MTLPSANKPNRHGFRVLALTLGALAALGGEVPSARAAGLYFADRGVRPAARGGAFIAGADDLGAIAYNPAGLFDAGSQFLLDASWLHFTSDYTRRSLVRQVDPNTGQTTATFEQTFPAVHGTSPVLPIPTIVGSFKPHPQWVVALGVWAPYAALTSYPEEVDGKPAPQRYSLITLDGSALVFAGGGAAFAPSREWRLGIGLGALVGTFKSTVVFSGCLPDRFFCAPEDPDWDVLSELSVGPIIAPAGEIGAIWIPDPEWRVGASIQLPVYIRAGGTLKARLPATPAFERAVQNGEDVDVSFDLPWNIRLGVETRAIDSLRLELGFGYERWGMHDVITVAPDGLALENVASFPKSYYLPTVKFPRNFQDTVSVRLGGEYAFDLAGYTWDARGGIAFETSAVPAEYLTVLTFDAPKVTLALGAALHVPPWRFDLTYAHVFAADVTVEPSEARISQISPVVANPPPQPNYVNGGDYSGRADVIGVGLAYTFDPAPAEFSPQPAAPQRAVPEKKAPAEGEKKAPEDAEHDKESE